MGVLLSFWDLFFFFICWAAREMYSLARRACVNSIEGGGKMIGDLERDNGKGHNDRSRWHCCSTGEFGWWCRTSC